MPIDWDNPSSEDRCRMSLAALAGVPMERCEKTTRRGRCRGVSRWIARTGMLGPGPVDSDWRYEPRHVCSFHMRKLGWVQAKDLITGKHYVSLTGRDRQLAEKNHEDWR